jgi:NAD(P)-dependent dehydrogenase (short-subunit alcohol dehydrogenase family)
MSARKSAPAKHHRGGNGQDAAVRQGERIQAQIDAQDRKKDRKKDRKCAQKKKAAGAMQAGMRAYPDTFPAQHLKKPGLEADLKLAPMYEAPGYKGSGKLKDMAAIVTGGDSGIGRAVAVLYAREGADVAIVYLNEHEDAEETKRVVEAKGRRCLLIPGDEAEPSFCAGAVKKTVAAFGKVDILVNNAAFQEHARDILDISDEHFDRTLKTNLFGYFYMARAVVPHMRPGSSIVMTGLVTGLLGSGQLIGYAMTKGGIHAFTRSLASNLVDRGHQGKCDRTRPGLDPAQSGRQVRRQGKEFRRRRAHKAGRPARGDRARVCVHGCPELLELHHRRNSAYHWRLQRWLRSQGVGKSSGETTMMQQGHTLRDRTMPRAWPAIFSRHSPSLRRIPRGCSSALTTRRGNPATLKAL